MLCTEKRGFEKITIIGISREKHNPEVSVEKERKKTKEKEN